MRQCGIENFTIEIIEECKTRDELNQREIFWIRALNCKFPRGYNQTDGGAGAAGYISNKKYQNKPIIPQKFFDVARTADVKKNVIGRKMTLGEGLKRFREKYGLSQAQVAKDVGLQSPQYRRYEYDKAAPSVEFLYKMVNKYKVSADYLLGLSDEPQPAKYDAEEVKKAFAIREMFEESVARIAAETKAAS